MHTSRNRRSSCRNATPPKSGGSRDPASASYYGEKPTPTPGAPADGPSPSEWRTPPLWGVADSAPYLHDGKAKTLHDVLTTCNKEDRHGRTSHLSPSAIDDLVAFLRALPYEPPPTVTANTVPYRLNNQARMEHQSKAETKSDER